MERCGGVCKPCFPWHHGYKDWTSCMIERALISTFGQYVCDCERYIREYSGCCAEVDQAVPRVCGCGVDRQARAGQHMS